MDFFGILFDMKNGKKIPYSKNYFDTLFAENLAGVTTLTGTLPLTFTTSETKLRSWTIYGADIEHVETASGKSITFHTDEDKLRSWTIYGNDNIGKNLLDIESATTSPHTTIDSVDNSTGSVVVTVESGYTYRAANVTITNLLEIGKTYRITMIKNNATSSKQLANATLRRVDNNSIIASVGYENFEATGAKSFNYTHTQERAESGVYFSLIAVGNSSAGGTVSVSNLMIREQGTTADFEPYQVGVGQRTKNKLEITATSTTTRGVTFTVNKTEGTITANGTASSSAYLNLLINAPSGNYYYSGCALGGSASTYDLFAWDNTISGRPKKWDGETNVDSDYGGTSQEIKVNSEHSMVLTIRIHSGYTCNNLVFKPMLRAADTDAEFIPYGYEVPLTISQTGQTDKNYDIFIGDSPLTEGESVSKTSTGVDIATADGNNTITTSLYNQPDMSITYNEFTGVGRPTSQGYEIALQCVGELSPYNPNAPESDTNYVYNATNFTLDTDARYRTALIDLGRKNQIKIFTIGKTKGETYKIQAIDYMGEWGGVDHYSQIGQTITPTEPTYTGSTGAQYLLVTYYDSEVDTLSPQEIRESITVSATVDTNTFIPIDAPLTEGQTVSKESTGVDIETVPNAVNSLRYTTDYDNFEMTIKYKE